MELLVQEQDLPQYAKMMRDDWMESLHQEGTLKTDRSAEPIAQAVGQAGAHEPDGEPPCPACGTAAPLVDGCCTDCGLHLE